MLLEIIALLLGVSAGTITGVLPGIHINLVASLILLVQFSNPLLAIIFLVSMAITHTFTDYIPATYFGAPDEDTALLPGHKFLQEGRGHEAVLITIKGSLMSIFIFILITPLFLQLPKIYGFLELMMPWILIWAMIFLVYHESENRHQTIIIICLAGFLGLASLNKTGNPTLPLLTGLFATPTLLESIKQNTKVKEQKITKPKMTKKEMISPSLTTLILSPVCSLLPGLGASESALLGKAFNKKLSREQFIFLVGGINTLVMAVSLLTLYLINKSRSGIASAISQIVVLDTKTMIIIYLVILSASIISVFSATAISKIFATNIHKFNYPKLSKIILITIITLVLLVTKFQGMMIFLVATFLGILCTKLNVRKSFLMSCLIIPTIFYYI